MQYRVKIYNENNDIISDDIWYGYSIDNVKFWVDMAVKNMIESGQYRNIRYYIESA